MAMKIFSKTKSGLKRVFGVSEITHNYDVVKDMAKGFYDYNTHKIGQTGQVKKVYIPVSFLERRERDFRNLFFLFLMILILTLFYFFYTLTLRHWISAILILCFAFFIAALCFRYHFWWIQVKKRKFGCTFEEWKEETVKELSGRVSK